MEQILVDKQAVEEIIMKYREEQARIMSQRALERAYGANKVGMLISELPIVKPIMGEWIPIKTRPLTEEEKEQYIGMDIVSEFAYDCELPEDDQEVLITSNNGEVAATTFCNDGLSAWFEYYEDEGDVIAWMPLPQPYEAESEKT